MRAELPTNDDPAVDVRWNDAFHTQFDVSVCKQNRMPGFHFMRQALQRNGSAIPISGNIIGCEDKFAAGL